MNARTHIERKKAADRDAVPQLVHETLRSGGQSLDDATRAFMEPRFGHEFGQVRVQHSAPASMFQPKLTISQPGDLYEQEADRVADQIMRMPEPAVQRVAEENETEEEQQSIAQATGEDKLVHRAATDDESEEEQQPPVSPEEDQEEIVHRYAEPAQAPDVAPHTEAGIAALRGGGQPLDEATRAFMEPRFGHDFSQVRVHTDAQAAESARSVNALAYTVGQDVVFGAGQYQPSTDAGRRLLAHELTHVAQQVISPDSASSGLALHWSSRGESDSKQGLGMLPDAFSDRIVRKASSESAENTGSENPIVAAKAEASQLLAEWLVASNAYVDKTHNWLSENYIDFIGRTSPNSRLTWSNDATTAAVSNALGNAASLGTKKGAGKALPKLAGAAAAGVIAAHLATPLGGVVVFLAELAIETAVSVVYDLFTHQSEKDLAEASKQTADLIQRQLSQVNNGRSKSHAKVISTFMDLTNTISTSNNNEEIIGISRSLRKDIEDLKQQPEPAKLGLSMQMLRDWVLEHAGDEEDAASDTNEAQWEEARKLTFGEGDSLDGNISIFAYQTRRHWSEVGLEGNLYIEQMITRLADISQSAEKRDDAAKAFFDERRYFFRATTDWRQLYNMLKEHTTYLVYYDFQVEMLKNNEFVIECSLDLTSADGAVYVDNWDYKLRYTGDLRNMKPHQIQQSFSISPD